MSAPDFRDLAIEMLGNENVELCADVRAYHEVLVAALDLAHQQTMMLRHQSEMIARLHDECRRMREALVRDEAAA